jgi:hypothetical protein
MKTMRPTVAAAFLLLVASAASAQSGGVSGAIDQQRQDMAIQQEERRREVERQTGTLQRQQERSLDLQLLQRQQPIRPPRAASCPPVRGPLLCN